MPTATLTLDRASYRKGDKITATYSVAGADPSTTVVTGAASVDGVPITGITAITLTTTHVVVYAAPTAAGLTFAPTADPRVWTAVA